MARNVKIENKVESNYQMNVTLSGEEKIAALEREVQNLNADLDNMTSQYEAAAAAAERFKAAADSAAIKSGLSALREELAIFKSTASDAANEFDAFLRAARLTDTNDTGFERFSELFKEIQEGSKTAQQAIVEVKQAYASVIEENWSKNGEMFDSQQIQQFDANLTKLGATLDEVLSRVTEMQTQGVAVNGEFASSGASVASTLQQIEAAARNMDDDLLGSYEAIAKLTSAMNEYASIDSGKLETIASTFRNMAKIGEGNFGGKSLSNLTEFFAQAQRLGDGSGTIRLNISGFESLSGLKTSKTWGDHLTTLGTAVKALNVNKLQSVASIDFSNLTNFKMSKATADNLFNLTNAMNQIDQLSAKVKALSDAEAKAASTSKSNSIFSPDGATTDEVDKLREKYIALQEAIEKVRTSKGTASDADIENIRTLQAETTQLIESINQRITAEKEAAAAKQKAENDKAAEAAKKEAAATKEAAEAVKQKAAADKEAAAAAKQEETEEVQRANALKQYQTILSQISTAQRNYSAAANSSNAESKAAYSNYATQTAAVERLYQAYQKGEISYKQFAAGITSASASVRASTDTIKANGDATKTLSERLTGLASKFSAWLSVSQVIMYSVRAVRELVSASIELDDAMAQLKIVTNETDSTYQNFAENISKTAQQIGASTKDLVDATTTYARLGYDLNDSSILAKYTGMLQQVGNIESQDAQDAITSMVKAFDLNITDMESVMDKLVAVGNGAPISVSQIAEAMTNASSTMAAAGNDINQTIALMTAANTTLQNAARSSTGLRTITARIRKTKTELDDLGEALSDSEYNNMIEALTKITLADGSTTSVAIKDANGQYRETYAILSDIAGIWDKLDSMSQAGIAEKLAGTRMQDVFYSIMNNWKEAENAMSLMTESAGTLQSSYDQYLETTTAHLQTFKSAFAQLGSDMFQTGFLNDIIDLGTALVNIVDGIAKVVNAVGGLKTVLIGIGGVIATIKADAIMAFVVSLPGKIAKLASPITALISIISRIPAVYQSMTSGTAVAVQGTSRLSAALQGLGITASTAQLAIGGLFAALTIGMMIYSKWKQHQEEMRQQALEAAENASKETKEIYDLTNEYLTLSDAVLTNADARSDLISAQDSIIEKFGIEKSRLQELVAEYGNYSDAIKKAAIEKLQEDERDLRGGQNQRSEDLVDSATSWWDGGYMSVSGSNRVGVFSSPNQSHYDLYKGLKALEDAGYINSGSYSWYTDDAGKKYSQGFALSIATEQDLSTVEGVVSAYKELGQMLDIVGNTIGQDNTLYENLYNKYSGMSEQVKAYSESNAELNENLAEQYVLMSQSDKLASEYGLDKLVDINDPETLSGYVDYRNALIEAAVASGEFAGTQDDVANAIDSVLANSSGLSQFAAEYAEAKNIFGENDELINWYSGLSDSERSIVYSIALSTDTADYQLKDWQDAIASYEIPEEDKISFSDLFTSDEDGSFKEQIDTYVSSMEKLNDAKEKLADGSFTDSDFKELVELFPELADNSDNLSGAIDDVKQSLTESTDEAGNATGIMALFEAQLAMCANDEDRAALEAYRDAILGITAAADSSTIEKMAKATTTLTGGISELQSALGSQQNGKSIDVDTFNSDELKDYRGALELVNGSMQLNADKCKEIAKAKAEEQIAINNTNKAIEQSKYLENAKEIEKYRQKLRDANFENGETAESVQASIAALVSENSAIADVCSQYDLLSASIREAVGEYQNWLNAQSSSDYGDMEDDAVDAINKIRNTFTEGTDDYGNFGSKKFDAAVDWIIPDSVDSEDLAAVESYMNDFQKYLNFDDKGNATGLNVDQFLQDSVNAGLMSYSDDEGFKILGEQKMEDFADGLGLSMGVVQAMFDELQLKGANFDWADESVKTIGDLAVTAGEAAEALRQVDGNSDLAIKMDVSDLATTEEQVSALDATIAEMNGVKAKPGVDASEIDNANAVIQYCVAQKQLLTQPDVMRVDTSQVQSEVGNAIALLQEFQNKQNEVEMLASVGADTSEAEAEVAALATEIAGISPEIKASLGIDSTSVDSIQTSIDGLTAELMVTAGVDDTAITGYNPETKECSVIYDPDTSLLPESFDTINRSVYYNPDTSDLPNSFPTITRYVNYVKTGDVSVNGTAHAGGTARAGGDWGTAPGGETLVGELG